MDDRSLEGRWSCLRCTLENSESEEICNACGNDKLNRKKKTEVSENEKDSSASNGSFNNILNDIIDIAEKFNIRKESNHLSETANKSSEPSNSKQLDKHISSVCLKEEESDKEATSVVKIPKMKRQTSVNCTDVRKGQEEEAFSQWQEIVKVCQEIGIKFVDDSFPPNKKSLTFSGQSITNTHISWLRPKEISFLTNNGVKWQVFRNPRPSDIIQGIIGNCWFLSALAVVCEKPELLEQILLTKEVCKQGVYQVRICKNGRWEIIIVDDLLPCDCEGTPVYSQAARNQLWVPLIEKAVAKSVGCYEALVSGRCIEALQILTGMPCESIALQKKKDDGSENEIDTDMVWVKILTCRNAGYLMAASCGGDKVENYMIEQYHSVGLEAQHAYSVLDVQQVGQHRLIRLRNPWGRFSWTGDWSDDSPLWTEALRRQYHPHGSVEGVFWISLPDMMRYFDSIDVCKYQPEWTEVALSGNFASPSIHRGQVCHLTVFTSTELDITLFQESNRGSKTESIASLDLMIGVFVTQEGIGEPKPISLIAHSDRKIKPSVLCNVFLDEGVYLIIPFAFNHWNSGIVLPDPPKYMLSIHSSKPVLCDHIAIPRYSHCDALFLMVEKLGNKHEGIAGVTCYYLAHNMTGLIVAAENRRTDMHLHVNCDCSNSFNVVATRGSLISNDCLPPFHRQILTILTQLEGADGYAVSHKLIFRTSSRNSYNSYGSHQDPLLVNGLGEVHNPRPL